MFNMKPFKKCYLMYLPTNDKNDLIDKMIYVTENRREISEKAFTWVKNFSWKNIEHEIMKEFPY